MTKIRAQACIMENNIWSFHKARRIPKPNINSTPSIFPRKHTDLSPEITSDKYLGRTLHRGTPRHTPLRECGGPERRSLLAARQLTIHGGKKQARRHQIRSPVGARQHHAGTRPLKRTADLVTEIGAGNLRGVGEKSRWNRTTNWWRRRVARARARGPHQRWAALPGPRASRRPAATCHADGHEDEAPGRADRGGPASGGGVGRTGTR